MIDVNSTTWKAVVETADKEIEKARTQLETAGRPEGETENLRGVIRGLRLILAIAHPKPSISS